MWFHSSFLTGSCKAGAKVKRQWKLFFRNWPKIFKMNPKERYFLAIIPPSPIYEQVMDIKTYFKEHYNCKAPLRSPAHITLQMPFLWSPKKESNLTDELANFAQTQQSFNLKLQGFNAFEPRVIYVDVVESQSLRKMQKALVRQLKSELGIFNADYKDRGFHPHMTVAFRDLKKPLFYQAWKEFKDKEFDASFAVNSFWLLLHDGRQWQPHQEFLFKA